MNEENGKKQKTGDHPNTSSEDLIRILEKEIANERKKPSPQRKEIVGLRYKVVFDYFFFENDEQCGHVRMTMTVFVTANPKDVLKKKDDKEDDKEDDKDASGGVGRRVVEDPETDPWSEPRGLPNKERKWRFIFYFKLMRSQSGTRYKGSRFERAWNQTAKSNGTNGLPPAE